MGCHSTGRRLPSVVKLEPTTWPLAFTATAAVVPVPPSAGSSTIRPAGVHEKARQKPARELTPTTWPRSFTATASLESKVSPRTPRSIIPPAGVQENACVLN